LSARTARRLAWGLWAFNLALIAFVPVLLGRFVLNPGHTTGDVFDNYWFLSIAMLPFVSVGALIAARQPANHVGWIMLAGALWLNPVNVAEPYRIHPTAVDGTPLAGWMTWLDYWGALPGMLLIFIVLPLLFPTGHLPSPRWRPLGVLACVTVLVGSIALAFGNAAAADARVPSVVRSERLARLVTPFEGLSLIPFGIVLLGVVASLVTRFVHARGVERQQLKWFVCVVAFIAAGLLMAFVDWPSWAIGWFSALFGVLIGLPVAIGIAILRYHLYAIDSIINRALVYGSLTVTLAGAYVGLVVLTQNLLDPLVGNSNLAIAVSTLVVAALFQPARGHIQRTVDRRFFRRKYDALRTVESFSTHVRAETDLEALMTELRAVVQETMQPAHVSMWLRPVSPTGQRMQRRIN
jgi:hypothetical protein